MIGLEAVCVPFPPGNGGGTMMGLNFATFDESVMRAELLLAVIKVWWQSGETEAIGAVGRGAAKATLKPAPKRATAEARRNTTRRGIIRKVSLVTTLVSE